MINATAPAAYIALAAPHHGRTARMPARFVAPLPTGSRLPERQVLSSGKPARPAPEHEYSHLRHAADALDRWRIARGSVDVQPRSDKGARPVAAPGSRDAGRYDPPRAVPGAQVTSPVRSGQDRARTLRTQLERTLFTHIEFGRLNEARKLWHDLGRPGLLEVNDVPLWSMLDQVFVYYGLKNPHRPRATARHLPDLQAFAREVGIADSDAHCRGGRQGERVRPAPSIEYYSQANAWPGTPFIDGATGQASLFGVGQQLSELRRLERHARAPRPMPPALRL